MFEQTVQPDCSCCSCCWRCWRRTWRACWRERKEKRDIFGRRGDMVFPLSDHYCKSSVMMILPSIESAFDDTISIDSSKRVFMLSIIIGKSNVVVFFISHCFQGWGNRSQSRSHSRQEVLSDVVSCMIISRIIRRCCSIIEINNQVIEIGRRWCLVVVIPDDMKTGRQRRINWENQWCISRSTFKSNWRCIRGRRSFTTTDVSSRWRCRSSLRSQYSQQLFLYSHDRRLNSNRQHKSHKVWQDPMRDKNVKLDQWQQKRSKRIRNSLDFNSNYYEKGA